MNRALLLSQLLDLHLTRSIDRLSTMSRHLEIADRLKRMMAAQSARLDALDTRMDRHETESDEVLRSYEGVIESSETAMKLMEDQIKAMKGNGGEAEDKVTKFPVDQSKALGTG